MLEVARHALQQGPVVAALGRMAFSGLRPQSEPLETPGPEFTAVIPARPQDLLTDYVRWCGGDPSWYDGVVPPHLFPQWGFPMMARALRGLPFRMARILNAGCSMRLVEPIPAGEPLYVTAQLRKVHDDGRRVLLHTQLVTRTRGGRTALDAEVVGLIPTAQKGDPSSQKSEPATVAKEATEVETWQLGARAGLEYACLTGDFNPVHWLKPYARAFGFANTIMHGLASMGRAIESMNRHFWGGQWQKLDEIEVRFTRPLVLPRKAGLFVHGTELQVGDAPGEKAYMTGSFKPAQVTKE